MRLLAYSDWHICHSWPQVSLETLVAAHLHLEEWAATNRPDIVFFLGDRYRARQPKDHIRAEADRSLRRLSEIQARHGGLIVIVVGNHDRPSESIGAGHTYSSLSVFSDAFPNVFLFDEPGSHSPRHDVVIHALPAGYRFDPDHYRVIPGLVNIFAFHGLVAGATYDSQGRVGVRHGITMSDLDNPDWTVVLGGDVHVSQQFPLNYTKGCYVGSLLRLEASDGADPRGFMDVQIDQQKKVTMRLVDAGSPRFMKVHGGETQPFPDLDYQGSVVTATVNGTSEWLAHQDQQQIERWFLDRGAVSIDIRSVPVRDTPVLVEGIAPASTPWDDVSAFIRAGNRDGLDEASLLAKAAEMFRVRPVERHGLFG